MRIGLKSTNGVIGEKLYLVYYDRQLKTTKS